MPSPEQLNVAYLLLFSHAKYTFGGVSVDALMSEIKTNDATQCSNG